MKLTPELLTLLKQLLDVCAQEAKAAEQRRREIQRIVWQINQILESMQY